LSKTPASGPCYASHRRMEHIFNSGSLQIAQFWPVQQCMGNSPRLACACISFLQAIRWKASLLEGRPCQPMHTRSNLCQHIWGSINEVAELQNFDSLDKEEMRITTGTSRTSRKTSSLTGIMKYPGRDLHLCGCSVQTRHLTRMKHCIPNKTAYKSTNLNGRQRQSPRLLLPS
jgi:hypothetical protein